MVEHLAMAVVEPDGLVSSVIVVEHYNSQIPGLTLVPLRSDDPSPPGIGWRYARGAFAPPTEEQGTDNLQPDDPE